MRAGSYKETFRVLKRNWKTASQKSGKSSRRRVRVLRPRILYGREKRKSKRRTGSVLLNVFPSRRWGNMDGRCGYMIIKIRWKSIKND